MSRGSAAEGDAGNIAAIAAAVAAMVIAAILVSRKRATADGARERERAHYGMNEWRKSEKRMREEGLAVTETG